MQLTTAQERAYDQAIAMIHDRAERIAQSRHFAEAVRERGYRTEESIRDFSIRLALASMAQAFDIQQ